VWARRQQVVGIMWGCQAVVVAAAAALLVSIHLPMSEHIPKPTF
jgi:hypothetical protein